MKIITDFKTGEPRAILDPGEKQYLASHNLKIANEEAWKKVKEEGAKRWQKRVKSGDTGLASRSGSTVVPLRRASMNRLTPRTRK